MANPAPTINQINAFNATQGTTIDFNIIGGTELVRSNKIYIYDLSDNSLICTHLYVSTESIHELPANTDSSIVYESGKSSADFVNGAQYYAQIQTFTDIAGTEGGSGLSVAKMFWCLNNPTLTIGTIPSTISTTSYNVSATYNANTNVVSNIIQQYQFNLYNATGSLLQSSGVIVGNGEQQGTSTTYNISYNFTGLSVGSSYYVTVEVTTTQGMSINTQSNTFTISIDTPTLGEATVVNNACDGYISVTSNLSGEYGGSGSGEIVSFDTDSENVFTKLQVNLEPVQDLNGYDAPWVGGAGKNLWQPFSATNQGVSFDVNDDGTIHIHGTTTGSGWVQGIKNIPLADLGLSVGDTIYCYSNGNTSSEGEFMSLVRFYNGSTYLNEQIAGEGSMAIPSGTDTIRFVMYGSGKTGSPAVGTVIDQIGYFELGKGSTIPTSWTPYSNICPISGWDSVSVEQTGTNIWDEEWEVGSYSTTTGEPLTYGTRIRSKNFIPVKPNATYWIPVNNGCARLFYDKNKNFIEGAWVANAVFTVPSNAYYMKFNTGDAYGGTYNNDISINYPSTDHEYHAYNGQTYTQEIEATYTPTVQENDVYLFKQTGDVGGDRETIELVGGTVAWNQKLPNARRFFVFSGTAETNTYDTDTHEQIIKMQSNGNIASYYGFASDTALTQLTGHVLLFMCDIKCDVQSDALVIAHQTYGTNTQTVTGSYQKFTNMVKVPNSTGSTFFGIKDERSTKGNIYFKDARCFDLTQMFGSTIADYIYSLEQANAGAGVAWFKKLFPKPYYAYNAGELMSVNTSAHNTVGFNAWDEVTQAGYWNTSTGNYVSSSGQLCSKNYIPVLPNTTYYYYKGGGTTNGEVLAYGATKNYLSSLGQRGNQTFTTPSDCYFIQFNFGSTYGATYNNDVCINLSWDGERDGEYEEYVEHSYPLDSSLTLRGIPKLDASNNLYYDGDTYESDGTVTRKYGIVDLGTLNYTASSGNKFTVAFSLAKYVPNASTALPNWVCSKYQVVNYNNQPTDKYLYGVNESTIVIKDTAYSDATAFKTAMSGVYLVYELATPTTETADTFESIQKVTPIYGTEEFVDNRAVPIPVGNNTQYLTRDIYGGTLDLVSGVLTVTHASADLGDFTWIKNTNAHKAFFQTSSEVADMKKSTGAAEIQPILCSQYKTETWAHSLDSNAYDCVICEGWANKSYIAIADSTKANLDAASFKTAMNGVQLCYELATPTTYQLTPQQIQTLVGVNNVWSEQGDIELSYHIPITNLLVKRQDVADVSGDWLTLYSQPITQASDMDFTFIDFTNQYGKTYKYALVPLLTQTQSGVEVEVEGGYTVSDEVQSVFDGVFIVDSTGSQKCKANVGYGNVDMNQTVGTITPIGAKYPVVITNSKNQYHNGSISGTIVPDDYYFNGNLSRVDMVNKRDELEQFLTNKRAKIIKDWNGNIWLAMIMDNVSCTFNNNYGMGIVNFNTNWVEVGDPTNQQDLQATGLIDVGGA